MNAYTYQAALYCEDCGNAIKQRLIKEGVLTTGPLKGCDPDDETTYDSGDYPKGPYPDGGGEADSIQTCDSCHCLLENPLTDDGLSESARMLIENFSRPDHHINKQFWRDVYDYYPEVVDEAGAMLKAKLTQ